MTLVVATIQHEDITIVADTKITFDGDEIRSASVFDEALLKIVLLRDNLAVGVAGRGPARMIDDLIAHRQADIPFILNHLKAETEGEFLVATLNSPQIWKVRDGKAEKSSAPSTNVWVRDQQAFAKFQELFHSWKDEPVPFRMRSSMDRLTSPLGGIPTVGGFSTTLTSANGRFSFEHSRAVVFPRIVDGAIESPHAGSSFYTATILPGEDPTRGALGIHIEEAQVGIVFPHEQPHLSRKILAKDSQTFAQTASTQCSQTLAYRGEQRRPEDGSRVN